MRHNPISRKEEAEIPLFSSYAEAKSYFVEKYGMDFILQTIEPINGMDCYFHSLVLDWETYHKGKSILRKNNSLSGDLGLAFIQSYQPIEIFDNGRIHIIH